MLSFFRVSLAALYWSIASHGYLLDTSCIPYQQVIEDGMAEAFSLAKQGQQGVTFVSPPDQGPSFPVAPPQLSLGQEAALRSLFSKYLFPDVSNKLGSDLQRFQNIFSIIDGLDKTSHVRDPSTQPKSVDVMIYCDYRTWTFPTSGTKAHDSDLDPSEANFDLDPADIECRDGKGGNQAITYDHKLSVQQIHLCKNFLAELDDASTPGANRFRTWLNDNPNSFMSRSTRDVVARIPFIRTPMDAMSLFSSTLLHELTHIHPIDTIDAGPTHDDSYGWKNCLELGKGPSGVQNADSYALFALGCKLIFGDPPERPDRAGVLLAIDPNNKAP